LPELAGVFLSEQSVSDVLDVIVTLALSVVRGADGASVSVRTGDGPRFQTTSASSPTVRHIDEAQYERAEGPCVEAIRTNQEVIVTLPVERWPLFSGPATDAGMRSVWSLPLTVGRGAIGALTLYSTAEQPWDDIDNSAARRLASQAAVVLANASSLASSQIVNHNLQQALENRDLIGQAKGLLMARQGLTADEAFDILRRASQHSGRKLRDIASEVVSRRGLPP
jgi:transcriptional regulator with GAF, ATPase, and Fis domain